MSALMLLPLGPRPVVQMSATARILIASQAPGTKVHESGIPFADASGTRLREWMGVSADEFYDESRVAILPMAFCYPGRLSGGGDAPPRAECAPLWRERLLRSMPALRLTLLVGTYAQTHALGRGKMAERVTGFPEPSAEHISAATSFLALATLGGTEPVVRRGGSARAPSCGSIGARMMPIEPIYTIGHSTQ